MRTVAASPALRALIAHLVDYAGLFPPAGLDVARAAAAYADHLASPDAWILGRFVVPVSRLDELARVAGDVAAAAAVPWRLSALVGDDCEADAQRIHSFDARQSSFVVDAAEARATSTECVDSIARAFGASLPVYVEVPPDPDPHALLEAVRRAGARAKIRTGGVTPDAFPRAEHVARFLVRCAALQLALKATAGLHHPLRGEHPLTYEPGAPSATMFGFLNVFVAGALAARGIGEAELVAVLEERSPTAFSFEADGMSWRGHRLSTAELATARATFAISFGSCSFRDPVDDLRRMSLV